MRFLSYIAALVLLGWVGACDFITPHTSEREDYVVQMFLTAHEPLPPLILSSLTSFEDGARMRSVPDASVFLELLDEEGNAADRWFYERRNVFNEDSTQLLGTHAPNRELQELAPVAPLGQYRLIVAIQGEEHEITATTTVPDTFSVVAASADSVQYRGDEQLAFQLTRSEYPGRDAFYIISNASLKDQLSRDDFTPDAARLYQNVEERDELEQLRRGSSPIVNEAGYEITEQGNRLIRVPWISFRFFGPNEVTVHALDDNAYDFMRSQQVQQGGSTLAPGETPNVIDHIQGATGVFGSISEASQQIELLRIVE